MCVASCVCPTAIIHSVGSSPMMALWPLGCYMVRHGALTEGRRKVPPFLRAFKPVALCVTWFDMV